MLTRISMESLTTILIQNFKRSIKLNKIQNNQDVFTFHSSLNTINLLIKSLGTNGLFTIFEVNMILSEFLKKKI